MSEPQILQLKFMSYALPNTAMWKKYCDVSLLRWFNKVGWDGQGIYNEWERWWVNKNCSVTMQKGNTQTFAWECITTTEVNLQFGVTPLTKTKSKPTVNFSSAPPPPDDDILTQTVIYFHSNPRTWQPGDHGNQRNVATQVRLNPPLTITLHTLHTYIQV
jgi:hypothetical protein